MHAAVLREIGWQTETHGESTLFFRPLGPLTIAKLQRPCALDWEYLRHFRRTHHTLTTYVEPGLSCPMDAKLPGLRVEPFAHSATSLIDIQGNSKSILESFSQKTRYNVTHTLKKGELTMTSTLLGHLSVAEEDSFFSLHKDWSRQKHVVGYPASLLSAILKCFSDTGELHLAYAKGQLVAALLTLYHDHVATYYAAFSRPLGYKLFAPTVLTWTAIEQAKANGCDILDFGGIYDPRYPAMYRKWQGFTKFKEGFRPTVVTYPETRLQLLW
jgi:lipid II:glycine glycyltransferase (peptidoglycan interpeptide bridge formation enzyme)